MSIKFIKKSSRKEAASLDEAFTKGYFQGSISRDELMERITKYNPELRWLASEKYMALWDTHKGFICGITRNRTIPMFSIFKKDWTKVKRVDYCDAGGVITSSEYQDLDDETGRMLARGWPITIKMIENKGYKVYKQGLSDCYFWDYKWKDS